MNNLTSLFPPNYKNLEQKDAVKLLEEIEKVVEEQDNQLEIVCEELKKVNCGKVISFDISINCDTGIFELSDFGYRIFASEEDAKNNTEINSHE